MIRVLIASLILAAPALGEDKIEYNRDVRPILADNCFACHGPDSASRKADLRLDQRAAAIDMKAIAPASRTRASSCSASTPTTTCRCRRSRRRRP